MLRGFLILKQAMMHNSHPSGLSNSTTPPWLSPQKIVGAKPRPLSVFFDGSQCPTGFWGCKGGGIRARKKANPNGLTFICLVETAGYARCPRNSLIYIEYVFCICAMSCRCFVPAVPRPCKQLLRFILHLYPLDINSKTAPSSTPYMGAN